MRARAVTARDSADVAQLVEQLIRNQQVTGSSPVIGSRLTNETSAGREAGVCVSILPDILIAPMAAETAADVCYRFGPFLLNPRQATLHRGAELVPLTPKVFDTLVVLVENAGSVLSRQQLIDQVWPDTVVVDSSLSQNIWVLRTALGEDETTKFIETVPRRGYRFIVEVERVSPETKAVELPPEVAKVVPRKDSANYSEEFIVVRRRRSRRKRANAVFAVIVAAAVLVTAIVVWRVSVSATRSTVLMESRLPIEERVTEIAISPDGNQLAYVGRDSQERASLFVRRRDAQTGAKIEDAVADVRRLTFSADNNTLHYQRLTPGQQTKYALCSYSLVTGTKRDVIAGITTAAVAPRSGALVYVPESTTEQRVILGERTLLDLKLPDHLLGRMVWSPDEQHVAAAHYHGGWYVSVIDPKSGTIRDVAGPWHTVRGFAWLPDSRTILASAGSAAMDSVLWNINSVTGGSSRLATRLHAVGSVSITGDGKTIATAEPSIAGRVVTFPADDPSARSEVLPAVKGGSSPRWCAGGFVAEREIGDAPDLWLLDETGKPLRQLTSTPDRETEIAVSPDGKRVAYTVLSADGRSSIAMLSLESGAAVLLTADAHARRPAFTHDGRSVLYSDTTHWWRSNIVSADTRQVRPFLKGITSLVKASPNGTYLVSATWPNNIADWPTYVVLRASDQSPVRTIWMQDAEQFDWLDDETLSFVKPTGADWVLFAMPVAAADPKPLATFDTRIESYDFDPATRRFLVATTVSSSHAYLLRYDP